MRILMSPKKKMIQEKILITVVQTEEQRKLFYEAKKIEAKRGREKTVRVNYKTRKTSVKFVDAFIDIDNLEELEECE